MRAAILGVICLVGGEAKVEEVFVCCAFGR